MNIIDVLVVDDDIAVCQIVQRMLSNEQYKVQTSHSVAGALGAIEQKPFDVYVMDHQLPDGAGIDVAERIRSNGGEAPIILMSGYDRRAVALKAAKLHISDFLEKPLVLQELTSGLHPFLCGIELPRRRSWTASTSRENKGT